MYWQQRLLPLERPGVRSAFLFSPIEELIVSEFSKQRVVADNLFSKLQTQSLSSARIFSEMEQAAQQREANMIKLRGLRLAHEASAKPAAIATQGKTKSHRRPGSK